MKRLILLMVLSGAITAQAETLYYIDGKRVSKGEATIKSLQDPRIEVLKVQINWTRASQTTANLKKTRDGALSDLPK